MMKIGKLLFAGVAVWAVAASAYAYRARDSAIRGWNHSIAVTAERDSLKSALATADAKHAKIATARADETSTTFRDLWTVMAGDPEISGDLEFAKAVTNELHQRVDLGPENTEGRFTKRMSRAMLKKGERSYCGELAVFLKANLMAANIPARTVQLATQRYVDGKVLGDTHVTVEALIDGKWTLIDATFNATFACSLTGDLVGVDSGRQCLTDGGSVLPLHHPATRPGRTVADHEAEYNLRLADFLAYSVKAATVVDGTPVLAESYPNDTWLREASKQYRLSQ